VQGVPFIIAKAGKPLVKVVALDTPDPKATRRTGFLPGISVPEDFNRMGESETQ
ncbi:MAG: type II toxin-antitoxin system prevent-host-death family antitoxin, partial [Acidimicrobiia bacterium]|nr:type II toxin-antitoxin system prevent-host-death family antitoxin [Acidimicrobiia bacterium]